MVVPTGTASIVLHSLHPGADLSILAQLVAGFLLPEPTWQMAISDNHTEESCLRAVQYLHTHDIPEPEILVASKRDKNYRGTATDGAAARGFLSVVQFLQQHSIGSTYLAMDRAAEHGHLHVIQWLHENANTTDGKPHFITAKSDAARNGHLEICLLGIRTRRPEELRAWVRRPVDVTVDVAVAKGHLEMVQWLYANHDERCGQNPFIKAVTNGSTDVVVFLIENGHASFCGEAVQQAARSGCVSIIQYLHTRGASGFTTKTMDDAAGHGFLDIVQFLHEHRKEGCTKDAMDRAAKYGHLEVVQFLHVNRKEGCTTHAIDRAAARGHLDIIQFLHGNGKGCTRRALYNAVSNGHLEIVQFLYINRRNGWHTSRNMSSKAIQKCVANGYLDVLQYLHDNNLVKLEPDYFSLVRAGHLDMMKFMYDHCLVHAGCVQRLRLLNLTLERATSTENLDAVQYLVSLC